MDPTTILTDARSALEVMAKQTADLLRSLPDANVSIPDSSWTVRQAAVHLANYGPVYAEIARGGPSPVTSNAVPDLARENAARIADVAESDPAKLSELMSEGVGALLEGTLRRRGDQAVLFHQGVVMDVAGLVCISLGEQVLHGYDMARAVRRPWPIDPTHAQLILYGYGPVFPTLVNPETAPGVTASFGIELRGGARFGVRFTNGECSVEGPDSGPIDCVISADPVAFLLVGSGRITPWAAIALGLLGAGGPRPELALGFADLFAYP